MTATIEMEQLRWDQQLDQDLEFVDVESVDGRLVDPAAQHDELRWFNWLMRVETPMVLHATGRVGAAATLRSCDPIVDAASARRSMTVLSQLGSQRDLPPDYLEGIDRRDPEWSRRQADYAINVAQRAGAYFNGDLSSHAFEVERPRVAVVDAIQQCADLEAHIDTPEEAFVELGRWRIGAHRPLPSFASQHSAAASIDGLDRSVREGAIANLQVGFPGTLKELIAEATSERAEQTGLFDGRTPILERLQAKLAEPREAASQQGRGHARSR